jgi:hypothetical protein
MMMVGESTLKVQLQDDDDGAASGLAAPSSASAAKRRRTQHQTEKYTVPIRTGKNTKMLSITQSVIFSPLHCEQPIVHSPVSRAHAVRITSTSDTDELVVQSQL